MLHDESRETLNYHGFITHECLYMITSLNSTHTHTQDKDFGQLCNVWSACIVLEWKQMNNSGKEVKPDLIHYTHFVNQCPNRSTVYIWVRQQYEAIRQKWFHVIRLVFWWIMIWPEKSVLSVTFLWLPLRFTQIILYIPLILGRSFNIPNVWGCSLDTIPIQMYSLRSCKNNSNWWKC